MASIGKDERYQSWNVQIYVGLKRIAGFFQLGDLLRISDVAHELELCLVFDKPHDIGPWQPALLPRDATSCGHIVLDHHNNNPFPTPASNTIEDYSYVFHDPQCTSRDQHSLQDSCIQRADLPRGRSDPRYLEIGKQSHESFGLAPMRKKRRSTSSPTVSRNSSPSNTQTDTPDDLQICLPRTELISLDKARPIIDSFRNNVLSNTTTCVVSGKGKSWCGSRLTGPGIEAAHIVPQVHWNTYPVDIDGRIVANTPNKLRSAWLSTWDSSNGCPMMSNLHKCFDLRLFSIHPITHIIRAFVNYDLIVDFHGSKAQLPRNIDPRALQHHWDMCCLENTPTWSLDSDSSGLSQIPELPSSLLNSDVSQGDPSKGVFPHASDTQASDTHAADTQTSSDMQAFRLNSFLASGATACPPSPPPSEPGSEEHKLWRLGHKVITDPTRAAELWRQGNFDLLA
ncbi:hypothetical protein VM1G_10596 [Cytospora mali]|uniref:HNH nuclease domain-containing protein n=1 Tax=Cytospora mali TaxID=578113 RepID=A0A194VIE0_CYTMA|nr:hypothetical protein VM1G_10596 [Valsa mali]